MLAKVAVLSLRNRKVTAWLTVLSIAVSASVLLGIEHLRTEARSSFGRTVSGVDLIVGARTGQLNLLLSSVFRIGHASNHVSWQSYQALASLPQVAWSIPIALGDSHRGYRVMGTRNAYFRHFQYGKKQALSFASGGAFHGVFSAVLGAEVAKTLNYQLGDGLILSHGSAQVSLNQHEGMPFTVVGILAPTGTPVDQTVHVSLQGIEAIHLDWPHGVRASAAVSPEAVAKRDLQPKSITAFMLGLNSKFATFSVQRQINTYPEEALLAIVPGVALTQLWQMMAMMENILLLISVLVLVASLLGMSTMLLASMRERRRELAILRAVGARPWAVFLLIQLEAVMMTALGVVCAWSVLTMALWWSQDALSASYGIFIDAHIFSAHTLGYSALILGASSLLACVPAFSAYRSSLHGRLSAAT